MALQFTVIQHEFRKEHNLSCNEYVLCDMVYYLSNWEGSQVPGWCYMSKEDIAENIGLTKRTILFMIDRLINDGLLIKNDVTRYLKTTTKWQTVYYGKESLPPVKNEKNTLFEQGSEKTSPSVHGEKTSPLTGEKTSPKGGEKTSPYNNSINNSNNNDAITLRKDKFFEEIQKFKNQNPTKYPAEIYRQFFTYWTEENKRGTRMKYEAETYFQIPKRIATFWRNCSEINRNKYWEMHHKNTANVTA